MAYDQRARVDSPETIREFRNQLVPFEEGCRQAVFAVKSDVHRVLQWIQHEQLQYWKNEIRKSEDEVVRLRSEYTMARYGSPHTKKPSYVDEEKALRKAERRRDVARDKIQKLKRWASMLQQQAGKLMGPIDGLSSMADITVPKARARLDHMITSLEEYLAPGVVAGGGPSGGGSSGSSGGSAAAPAATDASPAPDAAANPPAGGDAHGS